MAGVIAFKMIEESIPDDDERFSGMFATECGPKMEINAEVENPFKTNDDVQLVDWYIKTEEFEILDAETPVESEKLKKRERSLNFTGTEERVLEEEMAKKAPIIFGVLSPSLTSAHKVKAWESVAKAVNAVAPVPRKLASVKTKWKQMKRDRKRKSVQKELEKLRAGGGIADVAALTDVVKAVETRIGHKSQQEMGGIDSLQTTQPLFELNSTAPLPFPAVTTKPPPEAILPDEQEPDEPASNLVHIVQPPSCVFLVGPPHEIQPTVQQSLPEVNFKVPYNSKSQGYQEPPKKRIRVRRSPQDIKNTVVQNQSVLNSKIGELTKELKQRNEIAGNLLQLKKEEMAQNAKQHQEMLATQVLIASSLSQMLSNLQK